MPLTTTRRRISGWAGILGPVAFVATWAVLGAMRDGYDPVAQAISELGEIGAASRPWMSAAFVVFGVAGLPFAFGLARILPRGGRAVGIAAAVCGVMTVGAAFFPCTATCPGPGTTFTDTGHSVVAVTGYLGLMAAPLLTGVLLLRTRRGRGFAVWSIVAGGLGTVLMLAWAMGLFGAAGGAGQRIFNTLADVWWLTAGVAILRGSDWRD